MKIKSWLIRVLPIGALALLSVPLAASATPVVYTISSGGLDGAHICTAANCNTKTFLYSGPGGSPNLDPASGTITLDTAGTGSVAFSMTVASGTFLANGSPDNGVDEIEFTNLAYTATLTGVSFTPDGFGNTTIAWAAQTPGSTSVAGDYEQLLASANVNGPDAFAVTARVSGGLCTLTAANILTCGFIFGPGGPFTLGVGADGSELDRRIVQTLNVTAVPEPGTVVLVALGVAGIALRRRVR